MFKYLIIIIAILVVSWFMAKISTEKEVEEVTGAKSQTSCYYNSSSETLYIDSRNPNYSKIIFSRPHQITKYTNIPEQHIYTSATVGGVTTGGITKVGGYTEGQKRNTPQYELVYKEVVNSNEKTGVAYYNIKKISLSVSMLEEAKKSKIGCFINGYDIVVVKDTEIPSCVSFMPTTQAVNMLEICQSMGYPTMEKCNMILDWLCGNE